MLTLLQLMSVGTVTFAAFIGFLIYSSSLLDIQPQAYTPPTPLELTGPLAVNELLTKTQKLFSARVQGPESLAFAGGKLYTGTLSGHVIRIEDDLKFTKIVQFGTKCAGPWEQKICGRPLGIRSWGDTLYVVDGFNGLHSIDIKTSKTTELVSGSTQVVGKNLEFLNHLDVNGNTGKVYMTQFSTKWSLAQGMYGLLERDNTGRVLSYDTKTGKVDVVMDKLYGANGIQLTADGNALLVAETWKWRILRYEVSGPKKGQVSVFAHLPGEVDNIVSNPRGGYWAAVILVHSENDMSARLASYPTIRKLMARSINLAGSVLHWVADFTGDLGIKQLAHNVNSGLIINHMAFQRCMIVELDARGKILRSFQSSDPSTCFYSEVAEQNGHLYLASFANSYLGRLKI